MYIHIYIYICENIYIYIYIYIYGHGFEVSAWPLLACCTVMLHEYTTRDIMVHVICDHIISYSLM